MTLNELTTYYAEKLAYEYRGLPRATAQMQLYVKQYVADYLANSLETCYALDDAIGTQLDTLGKYIGVSRNVAIPREGGYFGLWTYASSRNPALYQGVWDPQYNVPTLPAASSASGQWYVISLAGTSTSPIAATFDVGDVIWSNGTVWAKSTADNGNGLTTYGDSSVNANATLYQYATSEAVNTALQDGDYRALLKLKIIQNISNNTLANISELLSAAFPSQITVSDNLNMTLTYTVLTTFPLTLPLLQRFLPRPMGVGISIVFVTPSVTGGYLLTESGDYLTTEDGSLLTVTT